jgi:hypothetical protein
MTQQTQVIGVANEVINFSAQLIAVYNACKVMQTQWTDDGVASLLNAQATVVLNSDGSLGAADGSPNTAHPIDPNKVPGLARPLSSTQLAQMKGILDSFVNYIEGQAIGANANTRSFLQMAVG